MWVRESSPQPSFAQYDNRNRLGQCALDRSRLNESELRNRRTGENTRTYSQNTMRHTTRLLCRTPFQAKPTSYKLSSLSYDRNNPTTGQPTCERERWIRCRSTVRLKRTKDTATSQSVTATHHDTRLYISNWSSLPKKNGFAGWMWVLVSACRMIHRRVIVGTYLCCKRAVPCLARAVVLEALLRWSPSRHS